MDRGFDDIVADRSLTFGGYVIEPSEVVRFIGYTSDGVFMRYRVYHSQSAGARGPHRVDWEDIASASITRALSNYPASLQAMVMFIMLSTRDCGLLKYKQLRPDEGQTEVSQQAVNRSVPLVKKLFALSGPSADADSERIIRGAVWLDVREGASQAFKTEKAAKKSAKAALRHERAPKVPQPSAKSQSRMATARKRAANRAARSKRRAAESREQTDAEAEAENTGAEFDKRERLLEPSPTSSTAGAPALDMWSTSVVDIDDADLPDTAWFLRVLRGDSYEIVRYPPGQFDFNSIINDAVEKAHKFKLHTHRVSAFDEQKDAWTRRVKRRCKRYMRMVESMGRWIIPTSAVTALEQDAEQSEYIHRMRSMMEYITAVAILRRCRALVETSADLPLDQAYANGYFHLLRTTLLTAPWRK